MGAPALTKGSVFFDAAKTGQAFDHLKPQDFTFLDAWFNDCDGCLLDSETLAMGDLGQKVHEGLIAAGFDGEFDLPGFITGYAGWHAKNIVEDFAAKTGVTPDLDTIVAAHKRSVIETLAREVQTFDGMDNVLALLAAGAKKGAAVVTSSEVARVQPGLEKNGIFRHFMADDVTHLYSGPDVMTALLKADPNSPFKLKPSPDIYLHAAEVMGVDIARTGTFEDSFSGAKSAVAAGIGYIIGFVGGSHIPHNGKEEHARKLLEIGVHRVVRDVREIPLAVLDIHNERQRNLKPAVAVEAAPKAAL